MEKLKLSRVEKPAEEVAYPNLLAILITAYLFFTIVSPVFLKNTGELPQFQSGSCKGGMELVSIRFDPGTYFSLVPQKTPGLDWMPDFHIGRFRRNSHDMADQNLIQWTDSVEPGKTIFYTLDYQSMQNVLMVVPTDILPASGSLWQVCGEWEEKPELKRYNIFYARTEELVNE